MTKKRLKIIKIIGIFLLFFISIKGETYANCDINCDGKDELACVEEKKRCWEDKINDVSQQETTLQSTIDLLNSKIELQELQISQTESEITLLHQDIAVLSSIISTLENSLDSLSTILVDKIQTHYKRQSLVPTSVVYLGNTLNRFLTQKRFDQLTRQHLTKTLQETEANRLEYDLQKKKLQNKEIEVENKKNELSSQKILLDQQKNDQQHLLIEAKNNKAQYEIELAKTIAEAKAIQAIIAGEGKEQEVGEVNEGDVIASVIVGPSPCSTGTHLHFEIVDHGSDQDPATYLRPEVIQWHIPSTDNEFEFSGSWNWPLDDPAMITQGWGMTQFARTGRYGGHRHTGIDILSKNSSLRVKAVKPGTLFRGSYNGCPEKKPLTYVRVKQSDSQSTYYLHVDY